MNTSEIFYYTQTQSQLRLTSVPGGTFVPEELVRGNPECWIDLTPYPTEKPKKIIIADWRIRNWSHKDINIVISDLEKLIDNGFELHVYLGNHFCPLSKNNLSILKENDIRIQITPEHPDEILNQATEQLHCARDELHVLDDYWMSYLLEQRTQPGQRCLHTEDLLTLDNAEHKKLIEVLKCSQHPLMYILDDEFSEQSSPNLEALCKHFPEAQISHQYKKVVLYQKELIELVRNHTLTQCGRTITLDQLKAIDTFELLEDGSVESLTPYGLTWFMEEVIPNIKNINFGPLTSRINPKSFKKASLLRLRELTLSKCVINSDIINPLLEAAPGTLNLNLSQCIFTEPDFNVFAKEFQNLTQLTIDDSPISLSNLLKITEAAKKLNFLKINSLLTCNEDLNFQSQSMSCLETIKIANSTLRASNLLNLLEASNNLKKLKLESIQTFGDYNPNKLLGLHQLESLKIKSSSSSIAFINILLNSAPGLKELHLENGFCTEGLLTLNPGSMPALKRIHLKNHTLSTINLEKLLLASVHLEELILQINNADTPLNCSTINFSHLKKLDLWGLGLFNNKNLNTLLNAALKLKQIRLAHFTLGDEPLTLKPGHLKYLSELDLDNVNLSPNNLITLLLSAPNLIKLKLSNIKTNGLGCSIPTSTLRNLQELEFTNMPITGFDELLLLTKNAPNLKKISFTDCPGLTLDAILKLHQCIPEVVISFNRDEESTNPATEAPVHNPNNLQVFRDLKPTPTEYKFNYQGINKTFCQSIIIEQISQYLTLTNQHLASIPKIQKGICLALAGLFIDSTPVEWEQLINEVTEWNGTIATLGNSLQAQFETLLHYINSRQLQNHNTLQTRHYLGDNLDDFIKNLHNACILENPWHAITIKPIYPGNSWMVYDPNNHYGYVTVDKSELTKTIQNSIGSIVTVGSERHLSPAINNPHTFLEQGGLVIIPECKNHPQMLNQIPDNCIYSTKTLDGILLRTTFGVPAWAEILHTGNKELYPLNLSLLIQFCNTIPDSQELLQKSIEFMSQQNKHECITNLTQYRLSLPVSSKYTTIIESIITLIRTAPEPIDYELKLQTWRQHNATKNNAVEYSQECIQPGFIKKRLIKLESTKQVEGMHFALEQQCRTSGRPFYYIHSPKDLICSASYIERVRNRGVIKNGPGGALHNFLKQNATGMAPVLIINYEQFRSDDLIRLNAILDKERKADGTAVPDDALIIGLINTNKPTCYQGADFTSRFVKVETCSVSAAELEKSIPSLNFVTDNQPPDAVINLFNSANWQALLLGSWELDAQGLRFKEGALVTALKQGTTIEIKNGLWKDKDFVRFWQQACSRGFIEHAGQIIKVPKELKLIKSTGYDWNTYKSFLTFSDKVNPTEVLNPSRLTEFLNRYSCTNSTKTLERIPGLIEAAKPSTPILGKRKAEIEEPQNLPIHLTRSLSEDEWAILLEECKLHNMRLQVQCAPGVCLPASLGTIPVQTPPVSSNWNRTIPKSDAVMISTDTDTTVAMLSSQKDWEIIDVSECKSSDLLTGLSGNFNKKLLKFEFTEKTQALLNSVQKGKNIILKGHFSTELADRLAPLLLERQKPGSKATGQIVLVTEQLDSFNYIPTCKHEVSKQDKLECLKSVESTTLKKLDPYLNSEPLSTLKARCTFLRLHPNAASSDDAWSGLNSIKDSNTVLEPLNVNTSLQEALKFTAQRVHEVNSVLAHAPYVFLAGISGVGKSTFVTRELSRGSSFYQGKQSILNWAKNKKPGRKILFLDEATLDSSQWSIFEGLFNKPPSILIDGVLYPLSQGHKVVFAGNPISYGDERSLANLFKRHGNSVVFKPLPTCLLYEDVLKPVFANTLLQKQAPELCKQFLEVYSFMLQCSNKELLISPRELQMMAIMTIAYCRNNPAAKPEDAGRYFAFELTKKLVPKEYSELFHQQFSPPNTWQMPFVPGNNDYLITPSRQPIRSQLDNLLKLRALRRTGYGSKNFQFGGLGGIILEGEPGIGKSELVINTLLDNGLKEVSFLSQQIDSARSFIRLPVSMSLPEKQALLCKACDEGIIVVIDEFNSSPMMESLLNSLLMGNIPQKGRPKNPGFMIIGTQNPANGAGRRVLSTALSRRLILEKVPPYSSDEMLTLLEKKGVSKTEAGLMISAYEKNSTKAKLLHLNPAPCFRDLLNVADEFLQKRKKVKATNVSHPTTKKSEKKDPHHLKVKSAISKTSAGFFKQAPKNAAKRTTRISNKYCTV